VNTIPAKGRRYIRVSDGQIRELPGRRGRFVHKVMCCDCGLVHVVGYRIKSNSLLELTAWRDNRATAARRTHRKRR
jgi:hypothetical protein